MTHPSFEDLPVWNEAIKLAEMQRAVLAKLPDGHPFKEQMRRKEKI